jgi:hypothetical protein
VRFLISGFLKQAILEYVFAMGELGMDHKDELVTISLFDAFLG